MADDRQADHQYHINRNSDAKRPMVIQTSSNRTLQGQHTVHKLQSQAHHDGIRKTPTPSPPRQHIQARSTNPTTVHIQMAGTKDVKVVPIHIPVQGNPGAGTLTQQRVVAGLGGGGGGGGGGGLQTVAAPGSYTVLRTGMVMTGGNLITVPTHLTAANTQRQSPGLTEVRVQQELNQRLTPPPSVVVSRASPAPSARQLAPPSSGSRSVSPRTSPMAQPIQQLLITPEQAQLLGLSGKLTPAQSQDLAQALAAQHKLISPAELSRLQSVAQAVSTQPAPVMSSIPLVSKASDLLSSSAVSSSTPAAAALVAATAAAATAPTVQKRPQSVPTYVSSSTTADLHSTTIHPSQISIPQQQLQHQQQQLQQVQLQQQQLKQVVTTAQVGAATVATAQRRLPANTTPQRFFAQNILTLPSSNERPQRPSSHPNLPLNSEPNHPAEQNPNLRVVTAAVTTATAPNLLQQQQTTIPHLVVPNGFDIINANGEIHSQTELRRGPSPITQTSFPVLKIEQQQKPEPQTVLYPKSILETELTMGRDLQTLTQTIHRDLMLDGSEVSVTPVVVTNHRADSESAAIPHIFDEKTVGVTQGQLKNGHPPVTVKQEQTMVRLKSPFNMRVQNLKNFPCNQSSYRATYRSQAYAIHRAKAGSITNAAKSLDLLRQNLQNHINKEIDVIIQRYMMYFKPGIENIKLNNGETTVAEDHVFAVCRQILEEAKKMYGDGKDPAKEVKHENERSRSPSSRLLENQDVRDKKINLFNIPKRRGSGDSDASVPRKKKKGRPPLYTSGASGRSTPSKTKVQEPVKREGPKWDPERLNVESTFIMGAKANKAMGLGNTRGRLYIKHPDIFKYSGDQDDKQWLFEHHYMPATGGKAYMILEEDIRELAATDEYKDNPGLLLDEIQGFTVPGWLISKMKVQMASMRSDVPKQTKNRSRSATPNSTTQESSQVVADHDPPLPLPFASMSDQTSPANTLDLLTSDHDDTTLHDVSPYVASGLGTMSPGPSISPAPSDLDALEEDVTTPFGTSD